MIRVDFLKPLTYNVSMRKRLPPALREYFRKIGANGGKKGGAVRASRMTPQERSDSARLAVQARWEKRGSKLG
jgi:hypothetical protein